jgi:hypothetical protein
MVKKQSAVTRRIKISGFIWLGVLLVLCLLFFLLRGNREAMNAVVSVTGPVKQTLALACSFFPFSVAEALIAAAILCSSFGSFFSSGRPAAPGRTALPSCCGSFSSLCLPG